MSAWAIILAAGRSERFGGSRNKVLAPLGGKPILGYSLRAFQECPAISGIVLVISPQDEQEIHRIAQDFPKVKSITYGGVTRQESVGAGLAQIPSEASLLAIHDGARPFITPLMITEVLKTAEEIGASVIGYPVTDTIKEVREEGEVLRTLPRESLWAVQTPQCFQAEVLREAYRRARQENFIATDDVALVERIGKPVKIVRGPAWNIKITTQEDWEVAEALLRRWEGEMAWRVGYGYDIHRLVEGRPLILGGVVLSEERGLEGYSDADALLHAVMDALLGACGLPDIGHLFPNTDPAYKGASSLSLLKEVYRQITEKGWVPVNLDVTVIAQWPKIAPHIPAMREKIAQALNLSPDQIGIKATTHEGLDALGRGEGIAVHAVASVCQRLGNRASAPPVL